MSQYYKQMQHGSDEARRGLDERLAREEMGDAAYEKMVAQSNGRTFKIVGFASIVVFAAVVLAVTAMGY